jgi:hypothetical protein
MQLDDIQKLIDLSTTKILAQ